MRFPAPSRAVSLLFGLVLLPALAVPQAASQSSSTGTPPAATEESTPTDTSDAPRGTLTGRVLDATTNQPLPSANILVEALDRGTATGPDGRFTLRELPTGTYAVRVSMVGYETAVRTPVSVTSGRPHQLTVRLQPTVIETDSVKVTADPFETSAESPTSVRTLGAEEVRRAPGAAEDVQRVMQSMPGVAVSNDRRNDLIVHGGSPRENLVMLDGIEVPNINHFGTQGSTGGPISMIDSDFLSDVTFYTGGFPARYGGALSSVLQLELREGSRQQYTGTVDLSMAGAGASAEGPISGAGETQGSWFVSGRRSYLDLIHSNIGLTSVPQYSSGQGKVVLDLSPADRLTAVGLAGRHSIQLESDADEPVTTPENGGHQLVGGVSWRRLWGDAGSTTLTGSVVSTTFETDLVTEQGALDYRNRSRETTYATRLTSTWRLGGATTLEAGGTLRLTEYRHDLFRRADTTNTGTPRPELDATERAYPVRPDAHVQLTHRPTERLSLSAGLRASTFSLSDEAYALSPRLSTRLTLRPSLHLNASWGQHVQRPELVWFTTTDTAADLRPTRATHWVAGLEWTPGDAWRLTAEGYYKDYAHVPVYVNQPTLGTINQGTSYGAFAVEALSDGGTAHAKGLELYAQRRLTDTFHAMFSYTLSEARYTPLDGTERPTDYDVRHMATVILGTSEVDAGPLGLLGGSVKLRYASAPPTTPYDREASRAYDRGIIDTDRVNAERLPDYVRFDVRLDRRDHFSWGTVTSYVEVQNATNHYNVAARVYDADEHTVEDVTHWSRFFVGGVEVEF